MRKFGILIVLVLVTMFVSKAGAEESVGKPVDEALLEGQATRYNVELAGAKDSVKLAKLKSGGTVFIVKRLGTGTDRMLTPAEFADLLYTQRSSAGWVQTIFNISSPVGLAWVALGLGGQILFTGRMLVQWISSEKSRKSVVPVAFWWMSLIGASMLLVYFIWRRDIVGILGQATGWFIYIRNLVLIHKSRVA